MRGISLIYPSSFNRTHWEFLKNIFSNFKIKIMATIRTNAIQILDENRGTESILDYHNAVKESDPNYFCFLFEGESNIDQFGVGMSDAESKAFEDFEKRIEALDEVRKSHVL
jgi:membrane-anchored protein YejM (alkaline phosphatase superfamily)